MKKYVMFFFLLLSFSVFSQDAVVYAFFKCTLKDDNGIPIVNTKVTVTSPNFTYTAITNTEGFFQTMVPEGDVVVTVNEFKKNIKVTGDVVKEYLIIIPRPGLLITINNLPDNVAYNMDVYCKINELQQALSVTTLSPGKYWVNLSMEATQLGFILSSTNRNINQLPIMLHYYTKFDTKEASRKIEVNYPTLATTSISVLKNGVKIKDGTLINGSIAIMIPDNSYLSDWITDLKSLPIPRRQQHSSIALTDLVVANGKIQLPQLMPGTLYNLSLRDGSAAGASILFNLNPDGKADITEYNIVSRKVSQKVFSLRGNPAINTVVKISYLSGDNIIVRENKTNAEGMVTWEDMPLGRAIIWGNEILPGVIMPEDTEINKPLNLPKIESSVRMDIKTDVPIKVSYRQANWDDTNTQTQVNTKMAYLQTGCKVSLFITAQDGSNKNLLIQDLYVPYCDTPESKNRIIVLPVTLNKNITSNLKITDKKGKGVSVSKLQILPDSDQMKTLMDTKMIEIIDGKDTGEYLINAPAGKYKLICDLYDVNNPVQIIELPADKIDINLNDPVCIAPSASVLKYITNDNPLNVKSLTVNTNNISVPVYGNKDKIVGWWVKLSSNSMKVKKYLAEKEDIINMQNYNVKFTNENNTDDKLRIYPAFPDDLNSFKISNQNILPNFGKIIFNDENQVLNVTTEMITLNLWNTKYSFDRMQLSDNLMFFTPSTKNTETLREIKYKKTAELSEKNIRITMPVTNLAKIATRDLPPGCRIKAEGGNISKILNVTMDRNGVVVIAVPVDATKITVYTPGQGIIKDYMLNGNTEISPAKYEPASKMKLTVYESTGTVMKNTGLVYRYSTSDMVYTGEFYGRILTDDKGEAVIENAVPGDYTIIVGNEWRNFQDKRYGWLVNMPENSPDISTELKPVDAPAIIRADNDSTTQIWWLADGETKSIKLPVVYSTAILHSTQLGIGTLLKVSMVDAVIQKIYSQKLLLKPGYNLEPAMTGDKNVSIILQMTEDDAIPPNTINIRGEKEWSNVCITAKIPWKALTGIGIFAAQVNGLPTGKWTAELKWAGKDMKIDLDVK